MNLPLVSVICVSHNHRAYVLDALESVVKQSYANVELIIVDDGSTDGTKERILQFLERNTSVTFIDIPTAIGNCAAFNRGWKRSSGEYLIDLAADDLLLPDRIEKGLQKLMNSTAGVHYCDVMLINELGEELGIHSHQIKHPFPEGDIYKELVQRFVVSAPSMMFKRSVIECLGGYDATLSYEDFDFWVRSARKFTYMASPEVLVKKRKVRSSLASKQRQWRNKHQQSTLRVCRKILALNQTQEEGRALKKRCWHEIRQCIKKGNLELIPDYLLIIKQC